MKIALLFPDYGSQYVGMIKDLYDESRLVQEFFEEASNCLPINFIKLCFASSEAELARIDNTYPALFLVEIALAAEVLALGIQPTVVTGKGIGFFAALWAAKSITMPDGLYFLSKYAQSYQTILSQDIIFKSIAVHGISARSLKRLCNEISRDEADLTIAQYETETDFVVTGTAQAITMLEVALRDHGKGSADRSFVEQGLYSIRMAPVMDSMRTYSEKIDINAPQIPLISTLDGSILIQNNVIKKMILKQIVSPVRWDKVIEQLNEYDILIEVGARESLAPGLRQRYPNKKIITVHNRAGLEELHNYIPQATV